MNFFAWLEAERQLSSAALTVRAQSVSPNDNGNLLWDAIMPRRDVPSVDLHEITDIIFRAVAERREWNAPARPYAPQRPKTRDITLVPIELTHKIDEYEMQKMAERGLGVNQELIRSIIGTSLPARIEQMAQANYRRIELDAFEAWLSGTVTVRNPQDNTSYVASYGFDPARYATAGTAWNNVGVNAYNNVRDWIRDVAQTLVGGVEGIMLRQATLNEITNDAPNPLAYNSAVTSSVSQVEARLRDELGFGIYFAVNEHTVDKYTTANGFATTKTAVFQAQKIAAIPTGGAVGNVGFAPVLRAMELAGVHPDARIDTNGMVAYRTVINAGKELNTDVQVNAIPLPDEQRIAVINVGV